MIKHYLGDTNKCWGVSRQTHLPALGDTTGHRINANRVMLQIEDTELQMQPGNHGYARRTFDVGEGMAIAGALTRAATACLMGEPFKTETFANCFITTENAEVVLHLQDMVTNGEPWFKLALPPEHALNMACMAAQTAVALIDRIISPAPQED